MFPAKFVIECIGCGTLLQAPQACKQLTCYQPACKRSVNAVDYPDLQNKIAAWEREEEAKRQSQAQASASAPTKPKLAKSKLPKPDKKKSPARDPEVMKRQPSLPYDPAALNWNRLNFFTKPERGGEVLHSRNEEERYCYCGENKQGMEDHCVQCTGCNNWFHVSCTESVPKSHAEFLPFQVNPHGCAVVRVRIAAAQTVLQLTGCVARCIRLAAELRLRVQAMQLPKLQGEFRTHQVIVGADGDQRPGAHGVV